MKNNLCIIVCLCLLMISGIFLWKSKSISEQPPIEKQKVVVKKQSTTVFDTVRIKEPVCTERKIIDTLWVNEADSASYRLKEQRVYKDSTYMAWVSGVEPVLDSIEVRNRTEYIEKTIETIIEKKVASNGMFVGVGVAVLNETVVPQLKTSYQSKNAIIGAGIGVYNKRFVYSLDFNLKLK